MLMCTVIILRRSVRFYKRTNGREARLRLMYLAQLIGDITAELYIARALSEAVRRGEGRVW